MHIPDGYLSPATCAVFYGAMAPVWYAASKRVEATLKLRQIPLLALGAAFTFVIMMFNIPLPGGSSGHMVGGAVVAIVLGPWAGVAALTLTLALQAFIFADGGITTLGANAFNMAFLMSFAGFHVYRLFASGSPGPARRFTAAALSGYVAVNVSALAVGIELGLQPMIARGVDGLPLYAPYPMAVAVPAMVITHLAFFGPVEAIGTGLVVSYLHKTNEELLREREARIRPLWIVLAALILLTPIGLIAAGAPWGEWVAEELKDLIGYVPGGMERLSGKWRGLMPGYSLPGAEGGLSGAIAYVAAALIGSALTVLVIYLWSRPWRRR